MLFQRRECIRISRVLSSSLNLMEILYRDDNIIAVNKPHGLLVHSTSIAPDADEFAVQILRDQIDQKVYPVHRLDRKTSGVLVFALNEETNSAMQQLFMNGEVGKEYIALVRGYCEDSGTIDYAIKNTSGKIQEAVTHYETLKRIEVPVPLGKHSTSRYSLVTIKPVTGRYHQIRKHFAHIFHPIIGDRTHGCNKQNNLFTRKWGSDTMYLHAQNIKFRHPVLNVDISIEATMQPAFRKMVSILDNESYPEATAENSATC